MKQYKDLLNYILENGSQKEPARDNMPTTTSVFGYQLRHNLADGFPILTGKEMVFKNIVVELLWFLRGNNNIKYLVDNGFRYWNEDAYNYYINVLEKLNTRMRAGSLKPIKAGVNVLTGKRLCEPHKADYYSPFTLEEFISKIKSTNHDNLPKVGNYTLGDTGYQYPKVWRDFEGTDQIDELITSLVNNPLSRRHIITSINPSKTSEVALYWCHAMVQFNCRPISLLKRVAWDENNNPGDRNWELLAQDITLDLDRYLDELNIPKYYLDCQMYQRSADVFLGVPYNIASYALLTHLIADVVNMVPGEYIHTFGDVHIYENHREQVKQYLESPTYTLPKLRVTIPESLSEYGVMGLKPEMFTLENYQHGPMIKAKLSTGLK